MPSRFDSPPPSSHAEPDLALVRAAREGDRAALDRLIAAEAPRVMRFALKLCRDATDAEDVLQDTLLTVARDVSTLRDERALTSWLYTVARSFCTKRARRARLSPLADGAPDEAPHASDATPEGPDDTLSRRRLGRALEDALEALEPSAREVVVLRDVEGLSAAETADALGIGVDAVKSRLHRARVVLRARLTPLVAPPEPTVPSDPACPDIVAVLSRHLEGDVGREACEAMEAHVATCTSCSRACDSLRGTLALCRASRDEGLDPDAAARVRRVLERVARRAP